MPAAPVRRSERATARAPSTDASVPREHQHNRHRRPDASAALRVRSWTFGHALSPSSRLCTRAFARGRPGIGRAQGLLLRRVFGWTDWRACTGPLRRVVRKGRPRALRQAAFHADERLVTIFARSLLSLTATRPTRRLTIASGLVAIVSAVLALTAAPAGAVITGNFGLQQREPGARGGEAPLEYHGGPVLHSSDAYVVYWDPIGNYKREWERRSMATSRTSELKAGGLGNVFAVDTQYSDSSGRAANQTTFRGSYKDGEAYPTGGCTEPAEYACLTDAQIQVELQHLITSVDPPLPGASGTPVYYLLTPPGVTVCAEASTPSTCSNSTSLEEEVKKGSPHSAQSGICGYHSAIELSGPKPIPYVVQPWIAGDAGVILTNNPLTTKEATNAGAARARMASACKSPTSRPASTRRRVRRGSRGRDHQRSQHRAAGRRRRPVPERLVSDCDKAEQGDMCQYASGPAPERPQPTNSNPRGQLPNETINARNPTMSRGHSTAPP